MCSSVYSVTMNLFTLTLEALRHFYINQDIRPLEIIINVFVSFSASFETYSMGLRPLHIFYSFSA